MTIKIPDTTFFGKPVKGAIERVFKKQNSVPKPEPQPQSVSLPSNLVASDYLQIPGTNHVIAREETLKGERWEPTHFKLQENGLFMPTPAIFMPHFLNVVDAYKNKKPLFDAAGNPIHEKKVEDIYKYLTLKTDGAWTWLDAKFKGNLKERTMKIHTNHRVVNDELKPQTIQDLEQCIKGYYYVKLEFNSQGLPIRKSSSQDYVQGENLYFWNPRNERVAVFFADSTNGVGLNCNEESRVVSDLGVFACASTSQKDSKDFIYVPSIGMYVAKEKTLHNVDWNKTHEELKKKGSRMPTIPEFIGFLNHLKQNPTPEYGKILDEIIGVRDPLRGEHLDARFEKIGGKMHINYDGKTEKLSPTTLMGGRNEINIDYWLKNPTSQGLPFTNTPTGNLRYWHPINGTVARFVVGSGRTVINCDWRSDISNSSIKVREVRKTVP